MNTDSENILDKHCNNQYDSATGEEEILSSKSSELITIEEYTKIENDALEKIHRLEHLLAQTECPHYYVNGHVVRYCQWCLERNELLKNYS